MKDNNITCKAPDVMVVFGRPKGDRGSYLQWEEDNIPPQVVFEILSPSNSTKEMIRKYKFYEQSASICVHLRFLMLDPNENLYNLQVENNSDRLDRYLSQHLQNLSRSRIQQLIEQSNVQLNGKICTSKKIAVKVGDRITLEIPAAEPLQLQPEDVPLDILYEDDSLLILNKPAGLVVHPAPGHPDGTLVNAILAHCPNLPGIGGVQRPGIVHRLDKDTTGAIAIAKTEIAHQHLQMQLKAKTARREYLGIVHGAPKTESGTIELPIGRHPVDRKKMAVVPVEQGGRLAVTHWLLKERLGNYTLMHFQLETGRTHQIRVHSTQIGHPIVGDPVYSSGRTVGVNLPGQALHAWRLRLEHPVYGNWIEVTATPPVEFTRLLQVLRQRIDLQKS